MNKRILSALISLIVLLSLTSSAFSLYRETEAATTESTETAVEQVTESQAETAPETTEAPTETQAPETTATVSESAESEPTVEDTTVSDEPTFQTVEETTAATESISEDVNIYETQQSTEVQKYEEAEKDPKLKVFFGGLILGLILGGVCGWFLATYIIKQKTARQHDDMYEAIKHGQKSISQKRDNELKQAEKEERLKKKKGEELLRKTRAEELKKEKAKKKEELKRQKDAEKLRKLQEKMGIEVTPILSDKKEEESSSDDVEVEILEEPAPITQEKPEAADAAEDSVPAQDDRIDPEKMIYQGEDNLGSPYYTDPDDPDQEPFRIEDGKKVFYD